MQKVALIVAGGSGKRMGSSLPKQFLNLGARPILLHTLKRFLDFDPSLILTLVLPQGHFDVWDKIGKEHLSPRELERIHLAKGGLSRTESVYNGLQHLAALCDEPSSCFVAIHDGVRPFVKKETIELAYEAANKSGASVVCVPVKSSMREQIGEGESRAVDRSRFYHVQTPQTFRLDKILFAYDERSHDDFTDDASLYEAAGLKVTICMGSYDNVKITTPEDIAFGESILKRT